MMWFIPLHVASDVANHTERLFCNVFWSRYLGDLNRDDSEPYAPSPYDLYLIHTGKDIPHYFEDPMREPIRQAILDGHEVGWVSCYDGETTDKGPGISYLSQMVAVIRFEDDISRMAFALTYDQWDHMRLSMECPEIVDTSASRDSSTNFA